MTLREPIAQMTKRDALHPVVSLAIRAAAFVLGMLACAAAAFMLIDGLTLKDLPRFYNCFIDAVLKNDRQEWTFLYSTAILLCISLALTPAFKMKFWNTGAEGQVLVGVLAAIGTRFYLGAPYVSRASQYVPQTWLLIPMLAASLIAGAVWALIPALFKAKWGTNETLFTLMMNYVAANLVTFFLILWVPGGSMKININNDFPTIFTGLDDNVQRNFKYNTYLIIVLAVIALMVLMYLYLRFSKHGYEISVVGESLKTAQYVGINVKKVIIRTMLVSGLLCGFTGFLIGAGLDNTVTSESVGGQGFTAIMVAWLAHFNPLAMLLTSGIITFLNQGAGEISKVFEISGSLPNVLIGIVLFFIIGSEFFINYKLSRVNKRRVISIVCVVLTLLSLFIGWYDCAVYVNGSQAPVTGSFGPFSGTQIEIAKNKFISIGTASFNGAMSAAKITVFVSLGILAVYLVTRLISAKDHPAVYRVSLMAHKAFYAVMLIAVILGFVGALSVPTATRFFRPALGWALGALAVICGGLEAFTESEEV